MQIDSETFRARLSKPASWEEQAFRYCIFESFNEEGSHVTSLFLESTFQNCEWYWALFNCAVFVGVKFEKCTFRGCSFSGCRFVECIFEDCEFTLDSLGKGCNFLESRWYGCKQNRSKGLEGILVAGE